MYTYREYGAQSFKDNPYMLRTATELLDHNCFTKPAQIPDDRPYWGVLYMDYNLARAEMFMPTLERCVKHMRQLNKELAYLRKTGYDYYMVAIHMTPRGKVDKRCNYYEFHFKNDD